MLEPRSRSKAIRCYQTLLKATISPTGLYSFPRSTTYLPLGLGGRLAGISQRIGRWVTWLDNKLSETKVLWIYASTNGITKRSELLRSPYVAICMGKWLIQKQSADWIFRIRALDSHINCQEWIDCVGGSATRNRHDTLSNYLRLRPSVSSQFI
jgi:hypothetical protein